MRTTRTETPAKWEQATKDGSLSESPGEELGIKAMRDHLITAENFTAAALTALGGLHMHEVKWRSEQARANHCRAELAETRRHLESKTQGCGRLEDQRDEAIKLGERAVEAGKQSVVHVEELLASNDALLKLSKVQP